MLAATKVPSGRAALFFGVTEPTYVRWRQGILIPSEERIPLLMSQRRESHAYLGTSVLPGIANPSDSNLCWFVSEVN